MRSIVLDARRMRDRAGTHAYIAGKLALPDYYGANLDALYDCLNEVGTETCVTVKYVRSFRRRMSEYGESLLQTLSDAARANPHLTVRLLETGREKTF